MGALTRAEDETYLFPFARERGPLSLLILLEEEET